MRGIGLLPILAGIAWAACPYMTGELDARDIPAGHPSVNRRADDSSNATAETESFLSEFYLDDENGYFTSDVGGPIQENTTLKGGQRGPSLLEDFIFRQKIQRFDHERVPERAVHARGAGAHGVFTSYGDWSNITAASFLGAADKETPVFIRFSTVAGSRGSVDTARDVHGFATRFFTDEGNFDIVGNNIPVFFIQDAILFPDLIHSVKPQQDREIPQAATAHDTAWDFFSQQPSTLHTLFWAMMGFGIPRSFRHVDGFGVHTFRMVTDEGKTKLIKWHMKTLQGKASLVWEEAQSTSGHNGDFHRQDLWDAIENGRYPEWEVGVQIMEEEDQLKYGFDLLDPTKIVPEDIVPVTILGKITLNRNPRNYFAETEQIMFQPGHIVRGIDFTEDPLLQGRLFSYLDTQLNRHGGPNFEQLPINRPRIPIHNNNRDGAAQMYIALNNAPYSPNTLNDAEPKQATQDTGRGFFTSPGRTVSGNLLRTVSSTFDDHFSQPRLFYNSLLPAEQQFLINAIRFEISNVKSEVVRSNVIYRLNQISHDIAVRVAEVVGITAPDPDPTYYHDNSSAYLSIFRNPLKKLDGLKVALLTSVNGTSASQISQLTTAFASANVDLVVVGEYLASSVNQTYSGSDATNFDGVIVADGASSLFSSNTTSSYYPGGRPLQIVTDAFRFGKPVAAASQNGASVLTAAGASGAGVYVGNTTLSALASTFEEGLKKFKFLNRFVLDS
ncbi:MAG: hypothetical protein M1834_008279 [Cirrosporium novae-zelandiae]|nr:MAG: hypothetical protein M1834_008279 [Cirrosporium novae-zelandiae]